MSVKRRFDAKARGVSNRGETPGIVGERNDPHAVSGTASRSEKPPATELTKFNHGTRVFAS